MKRLPDPELLAGELLERCDQSSAPVDLQAVIDFWPDLRLRLDDLDRGGYLVDLGPVGAEILVRRKDPPARRRYTIAHELAHWVLRQMRCPQARSPRRGDKISVEMWCDRFAAALLMPGEWLLAELRAARVPGLMSALLALPRRMQVSHTALRIRVSRLTPISLFEVREVDGRLLITHAYESAQVAADARGEAVRHALKALGNDPARERLALTDPEFTLLAHRFSREDGRQWLLALVPDRAAAQAPPAVAGAVSAPA